MHFRILTAIAVRVVGIVMAVTAELLAALWLLFGAKGIWSVVRWAKDIGKNNR